MSFINNFPQTDNSQNESEGISQHQLLAFMGANNSFTSIFPNINVRLFPLFAIQVGKTIAPDCSGVDLILQGFQNLKKLSQLFLEENNTSTSVPLDQLFHKTLKQRVNFQYIESYKQIPLSEFWKGYVNFYQKYANVSSLFQNQEVKADKLVIFMIKFFAGFYMRKAEIPKPVFMKQLKSAIAQFGPQYKESQQINLLRQVHFIFFIRRHQKDENIPYQELFLRIDDQILQYLKVCFNLITKISKKISHSVATKILKDNCENEVSILQSFQYNGEKQMLVQLSYRMIHATQRIIEDLPFEKQMQNFYTDIFKFMMSNFKSPINLWVLKSIKFNSESHLIQKEKENNQKQQQE